MICFWMFDRSWEVAAFSARRFFCNKISVKKVLFLIFSSLTATCSVFAIFTRTWFPREEKIEKTFCTGEMSSIRARSHRHRILLQSNLLQWICYLKGEHELCFPVDRSCSAYFSQLTAVETAFSSRWDLPVTGLFRSTTLPENSVKHVIWLIHLVQTVRRQSEIMRFWIKCSWFHVTYETNLCW